MNEQRIIAEIRELKLMLKAPEEPINEDEACRFLGISRQTMRDYVCKGKMKGTYTINVLGKRMFYKSKLIKPVGL